jgi:hypothetical protein
VKVQRGTSGKIALDLVAGSGDQLVAHGALMPSALPKPRHEAVLARQRAGAHALPYARHHRVGVHAPERVQAKCRPPPPTGACLGEGRIPRAMALRWGPWRSYAIQESNDHLLADRFDDVPVKPSLSRGQEIPGRSQGRDRDDHDAAHARIRA